jgi:hypothetical protein
MIHTLLLLALLGTADGVESEESTPSLELLEFLGSFETEDGEWLDPLSLDDTGEEPERIENDENHDESEDPDRTDRPDGDQRGLVG